MLTDANTLKDLDILRSRDGGPSVFDLLDRTKTKGGKRALRSRFENPFREPEAIRQVQSALRFLLEHDIDFSVDPGLVAHVSDYLDSSWEVGSRRRGALLFMDSLWVTLRYREFVRYAREGAHATRTLIEEALELAEHVHALGPPPELARPISQLMELIENLRVQAVKVARKPWELLKTDGRLRSHHRADLRCFLDVLYELDALCAMAEATKERGLVIPEIVDSGGFVLEGEGISHLFLDNPVSNPVELTAGATLVFLTGPNMSGKTTYLKTVGVSTFLAHVGMGVPATSFRFSPLDALFTSLSPEENLREGLSYFMAEVQRVREVAQALSQGKRALVLFDEVFKGTNLKDALEASRFVILGFAKTGSSGFIVSSHLVELTSELQGIPSIRFAYFDGEIRDGKARYDYRLEPGVSEKRFGVHLLQQVGVPELLAGFTKAV
ncbi:MAG: hypothetical protein GTO22_00700 [Gemmatimonadales bacterium]|nr:hypothetical protein [Gemmatimonadales bacterium]